MKHEHVPYFDPQKIDFLICLAHTDGSAWSIDQIRTSLEDVKQELDACLCEQAEAYRDIEIGYKIAENKKTWARLEEKIRRLEGLRQSIRDILDPPTEYIAFVEHNGAFWAQRRKTDGCKRPRANDRQVSKAKRFDAKNTEEFLKTLIRDGYTQLVYQVLEDGRNPIYTALV